MLDPADHQPLYTSAQAAAAAGVSVDTLKNWVSRQPPAILLTAEGRENVGKGHPLMFSVNRIIQIALTAELVKLGMAPRRAGIMAATFTDTDKGPRTDGARRLPGELFPDGWTVLIAYDGEDFAHIVNMHDDTPMADAFFPRGGRQSRAPMCAMVWVNLIDHRVRSSL